VLNSDRSTVKHALHNTQNDRHFWLSDSSRVHQMRFLPGLLRGEEGGKESRNTPPSIPAYASGLGHVYVIVHRMLNM